MTGCREPADAQLAPGVGRHYCSGHRMRLLLKLEAIEHAPVMRDLLTLDMWGDRP